MTDSGPWSVGGGPAGASPESANALDLLHDRGNGPPEDEPTPRPGFLRALIAILVVLLGLAVLWYLLGLAVDQLG